MEKRLLLGLHGKRDLIIILKGRFEEEGYVVDIVREAKDMIDYARRRDYDRYFMDLNLGSSGSPDITPAVQIYDIIKTRIESGEARFMGISGNGDAVKAAKDKGIPAVSNLLNFSLEDFIK